jgi:hypothetical protein
MLVIVYDFDIGCSAPAADERGNVPVVVDDDYLCGKRQGGQEERLGGDCIEEIGDCGGLED